VERSEWPDDDAVEANVYPLAPLPPHERTWRHPSEVGTATWAHTEPPLTIGRGLMITTGAIGGLLSLVVLWAMLPASGGGGTASPLVVSSVANTPPRSVPRVGMDTFVATSTPITPIAESVVTAPSYDATTVEQPTPSTAVRPQTTVISQQTTVTTQHKTTTPLRSAPMSVAVTESLIITTARAAAGQSIIAIIGADGQPHDVRVLSVDDTLGLALLAADSSPTSSYGLGSGLADGDIVTIAGSPPFTTTVAIDSGGQPTLDSWATAIVEGTPVLDSDGRLVGMCSRNAAGQPTIIDVTHAASLLPPPPPPSTTTQPKTSPSLGVTIGESPTGAPVVTAIDPIGPAAASLVVGDVITAIDGTPISLSEQLKTAIAAHSSGDFVKLTVLHADQTSVDVSITLASTP
jgi:putative serine protease PepD